MLLLLATLALATPFPRADEPLTARYAWRLDGDGPVHPRLSHRWRPTRVWVWPDGVAARIQTSQGRELVQDQRFTATGRPLTTVYLEGGAPVRVEVHRPAPQVVEVAAWPEHHVHVVTVRAPGEPAVDADGVHRWTGEGWELAVTYVKGPSDPWGEAFRSGLLESCPCIVEDHTTDWIDGVPGARYRLRTLDDDGLAEVWAVPHRDGLLIATYAAPDGDLARGRALTALMAWEDP